MLINIIHEKLPRLINLRLRETILNKRNKTMTFCFSFPIALSDVDRADIFQIIRANVDKTYSIETKFEFDVFSISSLKKHIREYISANFISLNQIKDEKIEIVLTTENSFSVNFKVEKIYFDTMKVNGFIAKLGEHLKEYSSYDFIIKNELISDENAESKRIEDNESSREIALSKELYKPERYVIVNNLKKFVGKIVKTRPKYICDIKEEKAFTAICGKITQLSHRMGRSEKTSHMEITSFVLEDYSGKFNCTLFTKYLDENVESLMRKTADTQENCIKLAQKHSVSNSDKKKNIHSLSVGDEVIIEGNVVFNSYSKSLEIIAKNISLCKLVDAIAQPKFQNNVPDNYTFIRPKPIYSAKQESFILQADKNDKTELADDFVILFVNTTGERILQDKILQIGAIKFKNGEQNESFECIVNCEDVAVSDNLLKEVAIPSQKYNSAPTFMQICPDLFKFCHNCQIVVQNQELTLGFLKFNSTPLGYVYENPTKELSELFDKYYAKYPKKKKPNTSVLQEVGNSLGLMPLQTKNAFILAKYSADILSTMF